MQHPFYMIFEAHEDDAAVLAWGRLQASTWLRARARDGEFSRPVYIVTDYDLPFDDKPIPAEDLQLALGIEGEQLTGVAEIICQNPSV